MEQNLVRHTLGKLNPAQMEAAKRRANIASQPFLPSKDGFRMSAHEVKSKERVKDPAKVEQGPGGDDDEVGYLYDDNFYYDMDCQFPWAASLQYRWI